MQEPVARKRFEEWVRLSIATVKDRKVYDAVHHTLEPIPEEPWEELVEPE